LDAHALPFRNNSLGNIIFIDVLHHLDSPVHFFEEAQRVLENNGRLIMLEPYISHFSYFIYNYFHQEDVDFKIDVLSNNTIQRNKQEAFDGNSAIPTKIFSKEVERFRRKFKHLRILKRTLLSFILYPLSGGFARKCFVPDRALWCFYFIEKILKPFGRLFAFRMFVVIEKSEKIS